VPSVYVIFEFPADTPVRAPVVALITATPVLELAHVPPPIEFVSVVVTFAHIFMLPPITPGNVFTVTTVVFLHPVGNVYVTIDCPTATLVTMPVVSPTDTLPLDASHVPPASALPNVKEEPRHRPPPPVMIAGSGFTVASAVRKQPLVEFV
jgi:hypothetical protein